MREHFPFQEAQNAIVDMLHDYLAEKEHAERLETENSILMNRTARLMAEVERLTDCKAESDRLKAEVERLRASSFVTAVPVEQYERVVKAGDAMAVEIIGCYKAEGYDPADSETLPAWNAAKEGKPSA